jgi:hypothetical protein
MALLDVTREIKLDHDNVRDLFSRYKSATEAEQKKALANTLIREMAIHSDAEEISVYNEYPRLGLGDTAEHNKEEHAEVKKLVYEADTKSYESADYDLVLSRAVEAFITHAKEEEDEQFAKIRTACSPEQSDELARAFLKARKTVPTRPHPSAPQTGGIAQKAAGMQGHFHDFVVEKLQGRRFVELQYSHPEL